jgi:hypothetical protein
MKEWMLACALVAAGCNAPDTGDAPAPTAGDTSTDRLVFKMVTKEHTLDECVAGSEGCTYVRLDYPVLVDAPEGYAVSAVTDAVFSSVTASWDEEDFFPSVAALMTGFIDDYRALTRAMPGYEHPWFLERKVFVLHNTSDALSLSLSERMFTGGAHGSATVTFQNLDPRTGTEILLSDLLIDDYEVALLPLAEARFREVRSIEDGMSLADAGFAFDNDVFSLTDNFSIGEDGLTFYYNPYDVAAYALGPTEISLRYDELDDLLKE